MAKQLVEKRRLVASRPYEDLPIGPTATIAWFSDVRSLMRLYHQTGWSRMIPARDFLVSPKFKGVGRFYGTEIISIEESNDSIRTALFVDYDDRDVVPVMDLKRIHQDFLTFTRLVSLFPRK